jgi:hypothetical protein
VNHCLNCSHADIHDPGWFKFVFCQVRMEKLFAIEADCEDFVPRPTLKALIQEEP